MIARIAIVIFFIWTQLHLCLGFLPAAPAGRMTVVQMGRMHGWHRHRWRPCSQRAAAGSAGPDPPPTLPSSPVEVAPVNESFGSLVKKYGSRYLWTWLAVYLPFLGSFYLLVGSDVLPVKINDVLSFIDRLCQWLQSLGINISSEAARSNPNTVRFATAYLAADLVPTTVFALALLSAFAKATAKTDNVVTD